MMLIDLAIERRIFGAIIADPDVHPYVKDLEVDDFTDLNLRFAFAAFRNLQFEGITTPDLIDIQSQLNEDGRDGVSIDFISATLAECSYYVTETQGATASLVRNDVLWLKRLTARRTVEGNIKPRKKRK